MTLMNNTYLAVSGWGTRYHIRVIAVRHPPYPTRHNNQDHEKSPRFQLNCGLCHVAGVLLEFLGGVNQKSRSQDFFRRKSYFYTTFSP